MEHVMFIQRTKDDTREKYIKYHEKLEPDLLKAHRNSGILREMIWIKGNELYLYIMSEDFKKSMKDMGEKKVFKDWIEKMTPLLDIIQDYSENGEVKILDKVFDLEEQLENIKD